ncbi:MAG: M14 family metallopeptidase [bacterium]|nr:M14 family metallopeptidase [bacterium]
MKNTIIAVVVIAVLGLGAYFYLRNSSEKTPVTSEKQEITDDTTKPSAQDSVPVTKAETVIGTSVGGNKITAYHYVSAAPSITPDTELLFIGGIHGGYEWNTALVAYEFMDYLKENPTVIPKNVKVTVIPVLNPDGLKKVVGTTGRFSPASVSPSAEVVVSGRFNANMVDLNRNFDCDWQTEGKWQTKTVSGGSKAFSESESQAVKQYVETAKPSAVVVWYSSAGGVFSSNCHNGVSAETKMLTKLFADASGYPAYESFNFYEITGDMVNWLAKNDIPAISVLLTNHTDTEWDKNQKGIEALLNYYMK